MMLVLCCNYVDSKAITSTLVADTIPQASSVRLRPSITIDGISLSVGPQTTRSVDSGISMINLEQSNAATITPGPTLNECAKSWLSYLSKSQSWYSETQIPFDGKKFSYLQAGAWKETCLTVTSSRTWTNVKIISSMSGYTLCPAESSRWKFITTFREKKTYSETTTESANCTGSFPKSVMDDLGPEPTNPYLNGPTCTINNEECAAQFEALKPFLFDTSAEKLDGGLAINNHNSKICDGYVTKYSCSNRFSGQYALDSAEYMNTVLPMLNPGYDGFQFFKPGSCVVSVNNFALIYFPPDVATRDICANNGWGTWIEASSKVGAIVTAKTTLISLSDIGADSE
jgi:hypothetical protein